MLRALARTCSCYLYCLGQALAAVLTMTRAPHPRLSSPTTPAMEVMQPALRPFGPAAQARAGCARAVADKRDSEHPSRRLAPTVSMRCKRCTSRVKGNREQGRQAGSGCAGSGCESEAHLRRGLEPRWLSAPIEARAIAVQRAQQRAAGGRVARQAGRQRGQAGASTRAAACEIGSASAASERARGGPRRARLA